MWMGDAEKVYDTGFMHMLMRNPGGGVSLFNIDLIENDGPGAGFSEKGTSFDAILGKIHARKILILDDPRAHGAWIVAFPKRQGKSHLEFTINGHHSRVENWVSNVKNRAENCWNPFPSEWLRKGENIIYFFCPAAATEQEG